MGELAPGAMVAGYRIESLVGRGGMGVVYRAVQIDLDRVVALKVIAPELLDDKDVRKRFLSEARAAASVDHPNVIPVHAAGEDDGVAYIAMRYVAGDDVRSLVRRGGALDPAEAAELVAQAGAALDAIHRAGFVHRDVKPANLLVDTDRHVYLTDFGLAKAVFTRTGGTQTGQWVGTLDYVAPEQIRGGRIDARADVYALGGVLHYALTGRVPFERDGDEAKLWAQLSAPPPVPSALRRGLRGQFDVAVARAMAKTADERYPSAGDLGRAARAAALGRTPSEPERMVARGAAAPDAARSEPGLAGEASTRTARPAPGEPGAPGWRRGLFRRGDGAAPGRRGLFGSGDGAAPGPRGLAPGDGAASRRRVPLVAAAGVLVLAAVVVALAAARDDPSSRAAGDATPTASASPTATPTPTPTPTATAVARVAKTVQNIGDRPSGIALAGGDLWVTSPRQPFITRVDAATGTERARHPNVGRDAAAIVSYRGSVWVALGGQREVVRLNTRSGKVTKRFAVAGEARRLTVDESGVWVGVPAGEGSSGAVLRYDRSTGKLLQTLPVREGVGGLLAAAGAIWVVKAGTNKIARLEPGADELVDWATLPAAAETMRYGGGELWVALDDEDAIARVDTDGRGLRTAAAGRSPAQALLVDGHVFVSSRNDNTVVVLDPETLQPVGEPLPVGFNPAAMVADARSVWVAGLGDNTLTRIDYR